MIVAILRANWKLALILAAVVVSFGLGVRWQRGQDAMEQIAAIGRATRAREEQEKRTAKALALAEARLATIRQDARDHTRKVQSHENDPDRTAPVPDSLLRELDAAAGAR